MAGTVSAYHCEWGDLAGFWVDPEVNERLAGASRGMHRVYTMIDQ